MYGNQVLKRSKNEFKKSRLSRETRTKTKLTARNEMHDGDYKHRKVPDVLTNNRNGQKSEGEEGESDLGIGTILQSEGKTPERLKIRERTGAIE